VKKLLSALTLATFATPTLAAAQDMGAPAPQLATPPVVTPTLPTPGELPTGSPDASGLPLLTFEEAIAMARKSNRTVKADRAQLAAAQTQTEAAWATLLPTITGQGRYVHNYKGLPSVMFFGSTVTIQSLNQGDLGAHATTPLLAPAAWAGLKAVESNVHAAEATFEAQEAELLVSVGQAFLAAAGTDELVQARRSSLTVARATLRDAQVRLSAGSVTKVDVDRAQFTVVRSEQQEREALTSRDQAYRTLATLIQTNKPFKVSTNFPTSPMPDPNDVQAALHLRPEFRSLAETAKSAEQEGRARGWQWAPTLSAFGDVHESINYTNFLGDHFSWFFGAQVDWLIFDGAARDAARHQANARAAAAREQAAVFADRVRDDLVNTSADLRTKQQGVQAAQQAVALSTESLDLIRTQYTAGTATQLDLLQAQDALIAANIALVQARFDVAAADLAFRYSAGTFPPKQ
jgi:outer membrane protein